MDCKGGGDPRAFYLGERRLHVMRVLERATKNSERTFRVSVEDGRVFLLRHDAKTGDWRLARVHSRANHGRRAKP